MNPEQKFIFRCILRLCTFSNFVDDAEDFVYLGNSFAKILNVYLHIPCKKTEQKNTFHHLPNSDHVKTNKYIKNKLNRGALYKCITHDR